MYYAMSRKTGRLERFWESAFGTLKAWISPPSMPTTTPSARHSRGPRQRTLRASHPASQRKDKIQLIQQSPVGRTRPTESKAKGLGIENEIHQEKDGTRRNRLFNNRQRDLEPSSGLHHTPDLVPCRMTPSGSQGA